jgi:hypothetical protein
MAAAAAAEDSRMKRMMLAFLLLAASDAARSEYTVYLNTFQPVPAGLIYTGCTLDRIVVDVEQASFADFTCAATPTPMPFNFEIPTEPRLTVTVAFPRGKHIIERCALDFLHEEAGGDGEAGFICPFAPMFGDGFESTP